MPQRVVYHLTQESYENEIKIAFEEFKAIVLDNHQMFQAAARSVAPSQHEVSYQRFINSMNSLQQEYVGKIMEMIQLETGQYVMEAEVCFNIKRFFFLNKRKTCSSKIAFRVEDRVKNQLRIQLFATLQQITQNIIMGESKSVKYPEYSPVDVKEL